jgi:hypothetical protein
MIPTGNSRFALVIAERPPSDMNDVPISRWDRFLDDIQKNIKPCRGMQKIHENVWLLPLETGIPFLGRLMEWADGYHIPLRILFLDEEPDWIKIPPDPAPPAHLEASKPTT